LEDEALKGKVLAVCTSEHKGEKKVNIGKAMLMEEFGMEGDAHAGSWHRQVSLLSIDSINKMRDKGVELEFGDFAENLTTEGISLFTLPIGTRMRVGADIELEVTQIGKECHKGCAIRQQVGDCVMPREGIFARVIKGGMVQTGDDIEVMGQCSQQEP
jgi:MOSC domain-containing protein YiiM